MSKKKEQEEEYVLTPWGCLSAVLYDYGIETDHIKGKVGEHIVDDFMDAMTVAGYVSKAGEKNEK